VKIRYTFFVLLLLFSGHLYSQIINQVGELKLLHATVTHVDTISENICGITTSVVRLTVAARTKVQLSCNLGDPSKNVWDTADNKAFICYAYDTTGEIRRFVVDEIKKYFISQEAWAKQYNTGNDFSYLPFDKSFYVNDKVAIPFIWSGAEREGDYQLFYLNNQVYKIIGGDCMGMGCLSLFVRQNTYFAKNGQRIDLGKYVRNIDTLKTILATY
jgi:hypothetical protein